MTPIREEIAKNLLYYRKKSGLSQKEFAEKLGVRNSTVSTWEKGVNSMDIEMLFKVCDVLGVSLVDMYGIYAKSDLNYSEHERAVINAYRNNVAMQSAVDKLLGIEGVRKTIADDIVDTISSAFEKNTVQK